MISSKNKNIYLVFSASYSKKILLSIIQLSTKGPWAIWPAFAAGQTVLRNHKPCCTSKERQSSNKQALLSIPKPPYLEQMESYLKKELQALDWTKENAQELKLQPYREVFEFFIDSFKTYKPLLSAIRNEYEVTLVQITAYLTGQGSRDLIQQLLGTEARWAHFPVLMVPSQSLDCTSSGTQWILTNSFHPAGKTETKSRKVSCLFSELTCSQRYPINILKTAFQDKGEISESEKHKLQQRKSRAAQELLISCSEEKGKIREEYLKGDETYQKKRICELELKAMVATASEECTLQIGALREKQKEEIRILEQEKQHLLKIIGRIKEEKNSLQTQVEHLQASVAEEYSRYLNEHSARKLLLEKLNDINAHLNMRSCQEQGREWISGRTCPAQRPKCIHMGAAVQKKFRPLSLHKGLTHLRSFLSIKTKPELSHMYVSMGDKAGQSVAAVKGEDVVKLTLALKVARQELTKAHSTLNQMKASYGDDVPRRDFESLEKKYSDLLQETKTLQKNFDPHKEYEALLEIQRETAEERDNFHAELQRVQHNTTPRPKWEKCSAQCLLAVTEVIPGGVDQWHRLAEGKTSDELVDVLLEEIGTRVLKEIKVFHGWGKGGNVPVYLRHEGEVRNRKLTKKDVVNIVKDVWKEKIALEQQTGKRSSLPEFFLSYLQKRYGDAAAMEWSYTLFENMRLCRSNYILSSTYAVLTGQVGEEQYHSQNQLISKLQKELAACDSSESGSLTSKQFSTALREAFPLKRKESIQELVDASRCKLDSNEDHIDYISLFEEDEEGNAEPFVAKLRTQYIREKQEYLRLLKNDLGNVTEVRADDLKTAFCTIDPGIDDQTLDTCIGLAYQVQTDEPAQKVVPVETVFERLTAGDVRVGPSHRVESTTGFEGERGDLQC
ncbi:LOW QUALITY PROTEIN: translin-associated factor X-interacting protein 1 [Guaruba guarouba]